VATPEILPTAAPYPVALPFTDTMDGGMGWAADGEWRLDAAYNSMGWAADSTLRGEVSTLSFEGQIVLGNAVAPQLSFWQKAALSSSDLLVLEISLDSGQTWQAVDTQTAVATDWTPRVIDLSAYRGLAIMLRFRLDTTAALPAGASTAGVWLDDVSIQDAPVPTPIPTDLPLPTDAPAPTALPADVPPPAATETPVP
jgi:hypothetical protein